MICLSLCCSSSFYNTSFAAEEVEFDNSFLHQEAGQKTIDSARFSTGNAITPGNYYNVDLYLNTEWKGKVDLTVADLHNKSEICLSPELLDLLDLKDEAIHTSTEQQEPEDNHCLSFANTIPEGKTDFDINELRFNVEIPQAYVVQRPRGYISPAQWQNGAPVAFVRYDANNYQYQSANGSTSQSYLSLNAGLNLAGWSFRHRGSISWFNQESEGYINSDNYLQHDVAPLRAQFMIGDFTTHSEVMENFAIRGVSLTSDDDMLPNSVRGYAPVIQGVANSNAKITVRQNNYVIYETTVPAGPFKIDELYPTGYSDDLVVEITEANGQKRSFTVPVAAMSRLIRPGYSRYSLSAGYYRNTQQVFDEKIASLEWQYGLINNFTLRAGALWSKNYQAATLGATIGTASLGNLTVEATQARANFIQQSEQRRANRITINYNNSFPKTNTYFYVSASRYLSPDFYQVGEVITANDPVLGQTYSLLSYQFSPKESMQISINQTLPNNFGILYLSGSTYSYWNDDQRSHQYQIGYSNYWGPLNYQFNFSQSIDRYSGKKDNQWSINFSLPLGSSEHAPQLSASTTHNNTSSTQQVSLIGALGKYNQYTYNLSAYRTQDNFSSYSAYTGYNSSYMRLNASVSQDNQHNRQYSAGASGAIVAHPYGITLSNDLTDTFAIIHAKGAGGAMIENNWGSELDMFGNGIVPYLSPYQFNQISIDPSNLPMDVDLSSTSKQIIPRANSAVLVEFTAQTGKIIFFDLTLPNGDTPPMAAEAFDQNNTPIGVVVQGGRLYTRNLPKEGTIKVVWGNTENERCQFDYQITDQDEPENSQLPIVKSMECKTATN